MVGKGDTRGLGGGAVLAMAGLALVVRAVRNPGFNCMENKKVKGIEKNEEHRKGKNIVKRKTQTNIKSRAVTGPCTR